MKTSSGYKNLDYFLQGGYDKEIITTIYGPSGSGKTNLCLLAAVKVAETGKKVIFIDTEGGIAIDRIKQLSDDYQRVLYNMIFFNPLTFQEQKDIFEKLREITSSGVGLIVVDSVSMLYRLELGKGGEIYEVNNSLGRQIACLVEIARNYQISVLITNQVYSDFENKDKVKMVGGDLLKYGSKCLIELIKLNGRRSLILKKHRSLPEGLKFKFQIVQKGILELNKEQKNETFI